MTLLACQIFSTIAHEGSFARTAEQLHLTPSAISHAVSTMEAECGFPLFTRTKSGVTMTAAAENLLPAIQRLLASSESLDQSIAQINGTLCRSHMQCLNFQLFAHYIPPFRRNILCYVLHI